MLIYQYKCAEKFLDINSNERNEVESQEKMNEDGTFGFDVIPMRFNNPNLTLSTHDSSKDKDIWSTTLDSAYKTPYFTGTIILFIFLLLTVCICCCCRYRCFDKQKVRVRAADEFEKLQLAKA